MTTPIVDFVRNYAASGRSRMHMPGHKGQPVLGCEPWDLTEIHGADELYDASGIIAESEANATALFGTAHTYYSTEGSSQCIRAMLYLALERGPQTGHRPLLLAARNAHKALLYAAALLDFDIAWLWPEPGTDNGLCSCPVSGEALAERLAALREEGKEPFAVYVTSPDYLGGMQDIAALSAVCHKAGLPLLVDNAHGAYLRFLSEGSRHPIDLGADLCCDSAHKTLPALTGGAYLHIGKGGSGYEERTVRGALSLFGSTSPSYLILQSLDACNALLAGEWPAQLGSCLRRLNALRQRVRQATERPVLLESPLQEPMKLTLDAAALGRDGAAVAAALREAGIEPEYTDPRYVVLMPSPANTEEELDWLEDAVSSLRPTGPASIPQWESSGLADLKKQSIPRCTIRQAMLGAQELLPADQTLGRICAMPTVSCPPAIPIAVSGEEIGPAAVELFQRYGIKNVAVLP